MMEGVRKMDISYVWEKQKFNYRVCAIMLSDGKILAMHDERSPYFYLPGGRVKLGETAEQAVVREVQEELGDNSTDTASAAGRIRRFSRKMWISCTIMSFAFIS